MLRRFIFMTLGFLEILAAAVLFVFAWQTPGPAVVHDGAVHSQTSQSPNEPAARSRTCARQLRTLRQQRPRLRELAVNLQTQMSLTTKDLEGRRIDYGTVHTVGRRSAMAKGLDGLSDTLDPKGIGKIGEGLGATADFLDDKVAPAADRAAHQLDQSTEALRTDAEHLSKLLRTAPLDLKAARQIHDSLSRFSDGLDRLNTRLDPSRLDALKDGFKGMEDALSTGAEDVDRLSGYSYPSIRMSGLRPSVEDKPFWPDGKKIAEGMRRAARGVGGEPRNRRPGRRPAEAARFAEREPKGRRGDARRPGQRPRPAGQGRIAVEGHSDARGPPGGRTAARLGSDLSKVLRETKHLKEVAGLLREAQKGVETAQARWPELRKTLSQSATLLRAAQQQMHTALEHRDDYDKAMKQTLVLSRTSAALPLLTEQMEDQLQEQDDSLKNLGDSIDQTAPCCQSGTARRRACCSQHAFCSVSWALYSACTACIKWPERGDVSRRIGLQPVLARTGCKPILRAQCACMQESP